MSDATASDRSLAPPLLVPLLPASMLPVEACVLTRCSDAPDCTGVLPAIRRWRDLSSVRWAKNSTKSALSALSVASRQSLRGLCKMRRLGNRQSSRRARITPKRRQQHCQRKGRHSWIAPRQSLRRRGEIKKVHLPPTTPTSRIIVKTDSIIRITSGLCLYIYIYICKLCDW